MGIVVAQAAEKVFGVTGFGKGDVFEELIQISDRPLFQGTDVLKTDFGWQGPTVGKLNLILTGRGKERAITLDIKLGCLFESGFGVRFSEAKRGCDYADSLIVKQRPDNGVKG